MMGAFKFAHREEEEEESPVVAADSETNKAYA
jgi:hypothetical protein